MPPSVEATAVNVPFGTLRSALVKPVTASEKVMVTVAVSPIFRAESSNATVAVGAVVSITIDLLAPNEPAAPGEGSIRLASCPLF